LGWLTSVHHAFANATRGHGLLISVILATLSIAIGLTVAFGVRPRTFLGIAVALNLVYWVLGQGFGGIFAGGATDPNAGPPFILLAIVLYSLVPYRAQAPRHAVQARAPAGDW
jgi:hypothetical protein